MVAMFNLYRIFKRIIAATVTITITSNVARRAGGFIFKRIFSPDYSLYNIVYICAPFVFSLSLWFLGGNYCA